VYRCYCHQQRRTAEQRASDMACPQSTDESSQTEALPDHNSDNDNNNNTNTKYSYNVHNSLTQHSQCESYNLMMNVKQR